MFFTFLVEAHLSDSPACHLYSHWIHMLGVCIQWSFHIWYFLWGVITDCSSHGTYFFWHILFVFQLLSHCIVIWWLANLILPVIYNSIQLFFASLLFDLPARFFWSLPGCLWLQKSGKCYWSKVRTSNLKYCVSDVDTKASKFLGLKAGMMQMCSAHTHSRYPISGWEHLPIKCLHLCSQKGKKKSFNWYRPGMQDVLTFTILARVGTFLSFILQLSNDDPDSFG